MPLKNLKDRRAASARWQRKRQAENPEQVRAYRRAFYARHKDRLKVERAAYFEARKPVKAAYDRAYRGRNAAQTSARLKAWRTANKTWLNTCARIKRRLNPQYRIANNLRTRINTALRSAGVKRDRSLEALIGCTVLQLMAHLEKKFLPGMSWGARNFWIDHVKPCAAFDLTDPAQQLECFNWNNLNPLWPIDNMRKGGRFID